MTRNAIAMGICILAGGTVGAQELAVNGDFETGDTSGWADFTVPTQSFLAGGDAASGAFAGEIFNDVLGSGAVVKQANVGIGLVNPGDEIQISFRAKGDFLTGGVLFAEFFTELAGGGTSSAEILSGGPIFVNSQADYVDFNFTVFAGPDTSGGITLQFVAATGAAQGSFALAKIDDVSIFRVPTPATATLLGLGGLAAMRRRR